MSIEKLDILLRSKLHRHESDVHSSELDSVFQKMGIPKQAKKKSPYYMILGAAMIVFTTAVVTYWIVAPTEQITTHITSSTIIPQTEFSVPKTENQVGNLSSDKDQIIISNAILKPNGFQKKSKENASEISSIMGVYSDIDFIKSSINNPNNVVDKELESELQLAEIKKAIFVSNEPVPTMVSAPISNSFVFNKKQVSFKKFLDILQPELGYWIAPMYSQQITSIEDSQKDKIHESYIDYKNKSERGVFTTSTGFNIQFGIMPFLNFGTGIGYIQTGTSYNYDYKINRIPIIDSATQKIVAYINKHDSLSKHVKSSGKNVTSFIEIPFRFQFKLYNSEKFKFGIEPAYTLQFITKSNGEYMDPVTLQLKTERNVKLSTGNMQLGIPLEFRINQSFGLTLTPFIGSSRNTFANNGIEQHKTIYSGIRTTLTYKLYNKTN